MSAVKAAIKKQEGNQMTQYIKFNATHKTTGDQVHFYFNPEKPQDAPYPNSMQMILDGTIVSFEIAAGYVVTKA